MRDLLRSLEEEGESANAEHIAHSYDGSRLGTSIEPELAGSTELRWDVITEGLVPLLRHVKNSASARPRCTARTKFADRALGGDEPSRLEGVLLIESAA